MPSLDWIGKRAVVNHHREVPTRLLHCDGKLSFGDPDAGNLLVQGDNLEALKALLPYYAGTVKCIYIDPPYNTGNESWVYNDNVNSPEMRAWLNAVVGKEGEDLSRHDKWLCMMYPRLRLLKDFLSDAGSIWISIDDTEAHSLKLLCDDIFGRQNFVSSVIWQKKYARQNDSTAFSTSHDHILVYAKDAEKFVPNHIERSSDQLKGYTNLDNDPRGVWQSVVYTCSKTRAERPNLYYAIKHPKSGKKIFPSESRVWAYEESTYFQHVAEERLYWGPEQAYEKPRLKSFLQKVGAGLVPDTIWLRTDVGDNQDAKREALESNSSDTFPTPKPERLMRRIIEIASDVGDIVLDSFAGSGTTGAVAQMLGRTWVMVEMGNHAASHITPRIRRVVAGEWTVGIAKEAKWTGGGGFRFCTLGKPIFDEWGAVNEGVTFADLAAFVFFSDTGSPIPKRATGKTPLLGTFQDRAIYMLFAPDTFGVADEATGNVLTLGALDKLNLPAKGWTGQRIVYAEGCTVPPERLEAAKVTFKQVPYQLAAS
jgi:DNA modification methylase